MEAFLTTAEAMQCFWNTVLVLSLSPSLFLSLCTWNPHQGHRTLCRDLSPHITGNLLQKLIWLLLHYKCKLCLLLSDVEVDCYINDTSSDKWNDDQRDTTVLAELLKGFEGGKSGYISLGHTLIEEYRLWTPLQPGQSCFVLYNTNSCTPIKGTL